MIPRFQIRLRISVLASSRNCPIFGNVTTSTGPEITAHYAFPISNQIGIKDLGELHTKICLDEWQSHPQHSHQRW